jgi:hypothetical protein
VGAQILGCGGPVGAEITGETHALMTRHFVLKSK